MLLQLATTKFCCVTMFEVGGNTANNAFQLVTQQCCVVSCSDLLLVLLHLKTVNIPVNINMVGKLNIYNGLIYTIQKVGVLPI